MVAAATERRSGSPTRAEALALQVERQIADGALEAGQRIGTKKELHTTFKVGIGTVNVAIRLLESRGLVEVKPGPGGGVFVAAADMPVRLSKVIVGFRTDDVPLSDWLAVHEALEDSVSFEAARLRGRDDIRDLRELITRMGKCLECRDELVELNYQLLRRKAQICRNTTLKGLYLTLLDHAYQGIGQPARAPGFDCREWLEAHHRLVEAIAAADFAALREAVAVMHAGAVTAWQVAR